MGALVRLTAELLDLVAEERGRSRALYALNFDCCSCSCCCTCWTGC